MELLEKSDVIWERCVSERICIHVWEEYCVDVNACLHLIQKDGRLLVRVTSFGQTWTWDLSKACYEFFSVGLATFKICIEPRKDGVRIVLQACLGSIKCWTLLAEDISLFTLDNLANGDLSLFGIAELELIQMAKASQRELLASISSTMTDEEAIQLLASK